MATSIKKSNIISNAQRVIHGHVFFIENIFIKPKIKHKNND